MSMFVRFAGQIGKRRLNSSKGETSDLGTTTNADETPIEASIERRRNIDEWAKKCRLNADECRLTPLQGETSGETTRE